MPVAAVVILTLLGLYPGALSTSCALPLMIGILGLLGAIVWFRAVLKTKTRWWVALGLAAAVVVVGEATNYKIAKAAFPLFRSAFERRALALEPGETVQGEWIGIYYVDEIAADERGEVYFRISEGHFFLAHDSVGFAYRASSGGSPFGDVHCWLTPIDENWSIFWASTD